MSFSLAALPIGAKIALAGAAIGIGFLFLKSRSISTATTGTTTDTSGTSSGATTYSGSTADSGSTGGYQPYIPGNMIGDGTNATTGGTNGTGTAPTGGTGSTGSVGSQSSGGTPAPVNTGQMIIPTPTPNPGPVPSFPRPVPTPTPNPGSIPTPPVIQHITPIVVDFGTNQASHTSGTTTHVMTQAAPPTPTQPTPTHAYVAAVAASAPPDMALVHAGNLGQSRTITTPAPQPTTVPTAASIGATVGLGVVGLPIGIHSAPTPIPPTTRAPAQQKPVLVAAPSAPAQALVHAGNMGIPVNTPTHIATQVQTRPTSVSRPAPRATVAAPQPNAASFNRRIRAGGF